MADAAILKPRSRHNLIGDHWPEISELEVAAVAASFVKAAADAARAEEKTDNDAGAFQNLLPEGFESQVDAILKVGGMAAKLSEWFGKCGEMFGLVAEDLTHSKALIASATMGYETVLTALEFEIQVEQNQPFDNLGVKAHRIQMLRDRIKKTIDTARQEIKEIYDAIHVPTPPPPPGLQPLVHQPSSCPVPRYGKTVPASGGDPTGDGGKEKGTTSPLGNAERGTTTPPQAQTQLNDPGAQVPESRNTTTPGQNPAAGSSPSELSSTRGTTAPGGTPTVSPGGPSSAGGASSGLSSVVSQMGGGLPSAGGLSNGLGSGSGLTSGLGSGMSGLSSGSGASAASPASFNPAQQFVSGAAQGFSQAAPSTGASAASAAAAQPFNPPAGSTVRSAPLVPAAPEPAVSASPGAPQQVVSSPVQSSAPAGGTGGVGGVPPLAPPPPAGTPSVPATAPAAPATPAAASAPAGGGPVSAPPPSVMNLAAKSAALRSIQLGSQATGEGLRSTPEFTGAMSAVAWLNDPERPAGDLIPGGWSCAVFGAGVSARLVIAERHGLSWIPAGVYLPDDFTVAHLDDRVPADVRQGWRGLEPSALVLAQYAKAIGEQPRIVVARAYHPGMPGWFGRGVVLAADEGSHVIVPNPLHEPSGRHRLQVAAPEHWRWVMSLSASEVQDEIHALSRWLVEQHNWAFAQWPDAEADVKLRTLALAQIGRPGAGEVVKLLGARMRDLATRLIGTPNYGTPQWVAHTSMEMALRGWEALLVGLRSPSHAVLADMQYAVLMATQPVLPPPVVTADVV